MSSEKRSAAPLPYEEPFDEDQIPVHMVAGPQALNSTGSHKAIVLNVQGQTEVLLHIQEENNVQSEGQDAIFAQYDGQTNEVEEYDGQNSQEVSFESQNIREESFAGENNEEEPYDSQDAQEVPYEGQGQTNESEHYEGEGEIETLEDFESQDETEPALGHAEKLDEFEGHGGQNETYTEPEEEEHLDEQMQEEEVRGQAEGAAGENEDVEWLMEDALTDDDAQSQPEIDDKATLAEAVATAPADLASTPPPVAGAKRAPDTDAADRRTTAAFTSANRTDLSHRRLEEKVTSTEDLLRMLGEETVKKTNGQVEKTPESRASKLVTGVKDEVNTGGGAVGAPGTAVLQSSEAPLEADRTHDADSDDDGWEAKYIQEAKAKLTPPVRRTQGFRVVKQLNGTEKVKKMKTAVEKKSTKSSVAKQSPTIRAKTRQVTKPAKVIKGAGHFKAAKDVKDIKGAKNTKAKDAKLKKETVVKRNAPKSAPSVRAAARGAGRSKSPDTEEDEEDEDMDEDHDFFDDESSDFGTDELDVMVRGGGSGEGAVGPTADEDAGGGGGAGGPAAKRSRLSREESSEATDFTDGIDDLSSEEEPPEHRFPVDLRDERASEFLPLLGPEAGKLLAGERARLSRAMEELQKRHKEIQAQQRRSAEEEQALRQRLERARQQLTA